MSEGEGYSREKYVALEERKSELEAEKERIEQQLRALREEAHEQALREASERLYTIFAEHVEDIEEVEKQLAGVVQQSKELASRIAGGAETMGAEELLGLQNELAQLTQQRLELSKKRTSLEEELSRFIEEEKKMVPGSVPVEHRESEQRIQSEPVGPSLEQAPDDTQVEPPMIQEGDMVDSWDEVAQAVERETPEQELGRWADVYFEMYKDKYPALKRGEILMALVDLWRSMNEKQRKEFTLPIYVPEGMTIEDAWSTVKGAKNISYQIRDEISSDYRKGKISDIRRRDGNKEDTGSIVSFARLSSADDGIKETEDRPDNMSPRERMVAGEAYCRFTGGQQMDTAGSTFFPSHIVVSASSGKRSFLEIRYRRAQLAHKGPYVPEDGVELSVAISDQYENLPPTSISGVRRVVRPHTVI